MGGDYRTNVESSVRGINSLIMEWNVLRAAEAVVLAHLPNEPAKHDFPASDWAKEQLIYARVMRACRPTDVSNNFEG